MAAVDFIDARSIEPVAVFEKDPAAHGDFDYLISAYMQSLAIGFLISSGNNVVSLMLKRYRNI